MSRDRDGLGGTEIEFPAPAGACSTPTLVSALLRDRTLGTFVFRSICSASIV